MAYIKPEGTIYLLQRIPLRPDLNMTIYPWASRETQFNWFLKHKLYTYEGITRVRGNTVMVEIETDRVLHCNYMMFQNKGYSNKWFYAFVTNVEFVNDITTRLTFQLDLFQSWCFDWDIQPCFVDREHVNDDTIGANTVPENLEHGEYICASSAKAGISQKINIGIVTTPPKDEAITGAFDGYIYNGGSVRWATEAGSVNMILQNLNDTGQIERLAALYATVSSVPQSIGVNRPTYGFTPKNNKLFVYPYVYALLSNLNGHEGQFEFENFSSGNASFALYSDPGHRPADTFVAVPQGYKGGGFGLDNSVSISGLPQFAFSNDTYKTWLAQTANVRGSTLKHTLQTSQMLLGTPGQVGHLEAMHEAEGLADTVNTLASSISGAINMGMSAAGENYGGAVGAGTGILGGVASAMTRNMLRDIQYKNQREVIQNNTATIVDGLMAQKKDHAVGGCSLSGNIVGGGSLRAGVFDLACFAMRIKDEFARIIDDYFSLYGYAVHRVKVPNFEGRYTWNYVKTAGCVFKGYDIPLQMQMQLAASLDAGMTFWHTPDNFGDYTQDNSIK